MRGRGGTATEPVVIEMSDETALLLYRALSVALQGDWTLNERRIIGAMQEGLMAAVA